MRASSLWFVLVALLGLHPPVAVRGAVPGEADPAALDRWALRTNLYLKAIAYWQGMFVGANNEGIYTSANALQWRQVSLANLSFDLIYAADRFVLIGPPSGFGISTNGSNWISVPLSGPFMRGITYADGKFVAVGDGIIRVSETLAESWTNVLWTNVTLWSVAYGAGHFLAVCDNGRTFRSTNAYHWLEGNVGTNTSFYDVVYAKDQFVAVANGALIYTSSDGIVWTQRYSGAPGSFYNVVYHEGTFMAAGVTSIVSSVDGQTWVRRPRLSGATLFTVAAGSGAFLVSGVSNQGGVLPVEELWQSSPLSYTGPQIRLPSFLAVPAGRTLHLSGSVSGTLPLSFHWEKDGVPRSYATNGFLTISNAALSDAGRYRLRASNVVGTNVSDSDVAVGFMPGFVTSLPTITTVTGATAVISATVTGTPPFTFVWRRPFGITTAVHIVYGTNDFLRFSPVTTNHAGAHGLIVTNLFGTNLRSGSIVVQNDFDGDSLGDRWETLYGLNTNDPSDASLDLDGDLHSNLQEFVAGSNPTNATSVLRIIDVNRTSSDLVGFKFTAISNMTYLIETKPNAGLGSWTRLSDVTAAATNRTLQIFDTLAGRTNAIYRIATPWQPLDN